MFVKSIRVRWLSVTTAFVILACAATYWHSRQPPFDGNHTYKIGYGGAPPLHFADENGKPTGLAVGVVQEAARRRGIRLNWVQVPNPGIDAVLQKEVDFWVLMADLPERHRLVYITEPYLVTEYCFLVPADSPFRKAADLSQARISYPGFGAQQLTLKQRFPHARMTTTGSPRAAFDSIFDGTADAAFLDQYSAENLALSGNVAKKLRIIQVTGRRSYMGLASSLATATVAEEIRAEMHAMAVDGTMQPLFEGWGFFPTLNLEAMDNVSNARRRENYLTGGVAALILFLTCSLLLVVRLRRQQAQLKRAELAVRESEDRFRTLSNASLEGIMIHDGQKIIDVNQACARLFGYQNAFELIGRNPLETLLASESREQAHERIRRRDVGVVEVTAVRKDGTPFAAETETRETKYLGRAARLVAWRDLTERRQAIAALRESEERYRALFERSLDCVLLTDFSGRFLDANQSALDLFGYDREEFRAISFESMLSPDQVPEAWQALDEILTHGLELQRREYRLKRKDGSWVFLECHSSLIFRGGKPHALQCIARDITERKRAEEENAKLQAQLHHANKMESIGRLAGGVAHDFNNLLTVILGYADMVLSRIDGPAPFPESQVKKALEQISRAAKRAADLTNQLLTFSRRNPSAPKTVRLNEIVVGVEGMLRPLLGEHIEVILSPAPDVGLIRADPGLLEQVLVNLAVNARDAMPEGGQLLIETSCAKVTDDHSTEAASVPNGTYLALWVADTGTGMTPEVQARVFEPFFTTKDLGKGIGLGLATVYGIVKQSGGHITLHSTPGAGTAFRILFPAVDDSASPERMALVEDPAGKEREPALQSQC